VSSFPFHPPHRRVLHLKLCGHLRHDRAYTIDRKARPDSKRKKFRPLRGLLDLVLSQTPRPAEKKIRRWGSLSGRGREKEGPSRKRKKVLNRRKTPRRERQRGRLARGPPGTNELVGKAFLRQKEKSEPKKQKVPVLGEEVQVTENGRGTFLLPDSVRFEQKVEVAEARRLGVIRAGRELRARVRTKTAERADEKKGPSSTEHRVGKKDKGKKQAFNRLGKASPHKPSPSSQLKI